MFYQLIKHHILIRRGFIEIKSLHVMYYRPFDRSMGLWIINEFLKVKELRYKHILSVVYCTQVTSYRRSSASRLKNEVCVALF